MKKILLSAAALVAAMSVNAQEYCALNVDENADFAALNLSSDAATSVDKGKVLGKTASVTMKVGADDTYKLVGCNNIAIGSDVNIKGGAQGQTNPKDAGSYSPNTTLQAPVSGAFFQFDVAQDGYLYVLHKASSNKAYTVFENEAAIGYTYSAIGDASTDLGAVYGFTLVGGGDYNWLSDAGYTSVEWPEQIWCRNIGKYDAHNVQQEDGSYKWTNIAKGGMGVIKIAVYKDCTYLVNANGSKMTCSGFYFDTTGDATMVTKVNDEDVVLLDAGNVPGVQTAISTVKTAENVNAPMYNLAGQQVGKDYKGVVIQNGKKIVRF